jgi:gas vesicle protein
MGGITIAIVGGIAGALATYLLMRGSEISSKIYERQKKNFNALVQLEYQCCENMNNITDNIFVIDDFVETSEKPLTQNKPIVYGNKLFPIPFDDSLVLNFSAADFINAVLEHKIDIIKVNHDMQSINEMYEAFKNALIRKDIDFGSYKFNALLAIEKCKQLKIFLGNLENKTIRLGACAGLLAREGKPLLARLIHMFLRKKIFTDKFNKRLEKEITRVKESRQEVMNRSQEELEKIKEKIKKTT